MFSKVIQGLLTILIVLFLSPLFEGVLRKLKALIQSRIGPPLIQPYLDLLKLLGKEEMEVSHSFLGRFTPLLALCSVLVASLLVPLGGGRALSSGDMILFIYLIAISAVAIILAGLDSGTPFSVAGASRETMSFLVVEPVLFIALITASIKARSFDFFAMMNWHYTSGLSLSMGISAVAFFLALQAQFSKIPFDIPEAETEIMGGPFIEQSGPRLAFFKWAFFAKQILFTSLFCQVFIPWPKTFVFGVDLLINLVKMLVVIVLVGVIDAVNPRLRIDQAIVYFFGVIVAALVGLTFALVGA
ncbi:MAG: NADH-quinone oxidoreductase subunit H [Candidatus Edwardsbacteria bacterium]